MSHIRFCFSPEFFSEHGSKHMAKRLEYLVMTEKMKLKEGKELRFKQEGDSEKVPLWGLPMVPDSCQRSAMSAPKTDCGLAI